MGVVLPHSGFEFFRQFLFSLLSLSREEREISISVIVIVCFPQNISSRHFAEMSASQFKTLSHQQKENLGNPSSSNVDIIFVRGWDFQQIRSAPCVEVICTLFVLKHFEKFQMWILTDTIKAEHALLVKKSKDKLKKDARELNVKVNC
jgi:hypothetical protein